MLPWEDDITAHHSGEGCLLHSSQEAKREEKAEVPRSHETVWPMSWHSSSRICLLKISSHLRTRETGDRAFDNRNLRMFIIQDTRSINLSPYWLTFIIIYIYLLLFKFYWIPPCKSLNNYSKIYLFIMKIILALLWVDTLDSSKKFILH